MFSPECQSHIIEVPSKGVTITPTRRRITRKHQKALKQALRAWRAACMDPAQSLKILAFAFWDGTGASYTDVRYPGRVTSRKIPRDIRGFRS